MILAGKANPSNSLIFEMASALGVESGALINALLKRHKEVETMQWLSVSTVSKLMAYSERAIRRKATEEKEFGSHGFRYRAGKRGGKQLQIALEALPAQAQAAYRRQQDETIPFRNEAIFTQAQRAEAEHRKHVVLLSSSTRQAA